MHCTQNVTTENHRIMATLGALIITVLLTFGSIGVSGDTGQLSTTTGDTVLILCDFGEGTIRNLYWYYNDGTGPVKILTLFQGAVSVDATYAHRVSLYDDNSTLIMTDITVKDEGTYRCDVDREGQTAVPNINTKLYVFSLTPDTVPEISECTEVDESPACTVHSNRYISISCVLRRVYPAEDAKLIWYQDGQLVTSLNDLTPKDDGTEDMIGSIRVSESGNFTCNASFLTAQGAENAAVSVAVWITPKSENTPGKKLTTGQTASIVVCALAVPLLVIMTIAFLIVQKRRKKRQREKNKDAAETVPLHPSDNRTVVMDLVEDHKLVLLASNFPVGKFHEFCLQLDRTYNDVDEVLNKHSKDCKKALLEILMAWKTQTGGPRSVLQAALEKAGVGGLRGLIAGDKTETHPVQETTNDSGPNDRQSSPIQRLDKTRVSHSQPSDGMNGETKKNTASNSSLPKASTGKQEDILDRSHERETTDEEITRLSNLLAVENYIPLCVALNMDINYSKSLVTKNQLNYTSAFVEILSKWKTKTGGLILDLDKALVTAEAGGLRARYKNQ